MIDGRDDLGPIVAARREAPQDDLISVLVQAEITDEDGSKHRLSDPEIYSFAVLLLAAGSGTTWKQMGITLAALLDRPGVLGGPSRTDPHLLKAAIEEVPAVDADRSDVLPVGRRGHRLLRRAPAEGVGAAPVHRRRQP